MHQNITYLLESYATMFVASSPIAYVALYVAMTQTYTQKEKWLTSKAACHIAFGIIFVCWLFGNNLLDFIGIKISSFRIAGGLILLKMALELLKTNVNDDLSEDEINDLNKLNKANIIITPLAFPMIIGPGAISSTMIVKSIATNSIQLLFSLLNVILIMLTFYAMFYVASFSSKILSKTIIRVSSRISGIIVLGLACEFILNGIKDFF